MGIQSSVWVASEMERLRVGSKSRLTLVTGPRIAAFVELLNGYKEAFSDVKTHFR